MIYPSEAKYMGCWKTRRNDNFRVLPKIIVDVHFRDKKGHLRAWRNLASYPRKQLQEIGAEVMCTTTRIRLQDAVRVAQHIHKVMAEGRTQEDVLEDDNNDSQGPGIHLGKRRCYRPAAYSDIDARQNAASNDVEDRPETASPDVYIALSSDGVPESKQSGRSIDIQTLRLIGCKLCIPLSVVRKKSTFSKELSTRLVWDQIAREFNLLPHVKLHHCSFDAPKVSEVAGIKGHGGYWSCIICNIKGERYAKRNKKGEKVEGEKTIFTVEATREASLRTDKGIKYIMEHLDELDEEGREGIMFESPLLNLDGFNFEKHLAVDYLHLICLGKCVTILYFLSLYFLSL